MLRAVVLAAAFVAAVGCASTERRTVCARPTAEYSRMEIEDFGDAARLERLVRRNYTVYREWVRYADCLANR